MRLIQGDCLEVMDNLIAEGVKVDLTVTSPPYDKLRTYDGTLQWDTDIWRGVMVWLYTITKPGGVVVWVVGDATINGSETGTSFRQALYAMEAGFNLHDTMIWNKGGFTAVGTLRTRYASVFEYMFIFTKGKIKTFNPIKDRENIHVGMKNHGTIRQADGSVKRVSNNKPRGKYGQRFNIWRIPNPGKAGNNHPATFPESLARDHIISWSNPGDIVFDPFLGSGTTGKMAKELGRDFIGIEKVEKYFNIAKNRIDFITVDKQDLLF